MDDIRDFCNFSTTKPKKKCPNHVEIILIGRGCCEYHYNHQCWSTEDERKNPRTLTQWIQLTTHPAFKG